MFTGLIESCVPLRALEARGEGLRMRVASPGPSWDLRAGSSIAVSGSCLTLVEGADPATGAALPVGTPGADLVFDLSAETLRRTWFGRAQAGRRVNLERAMLLSDRLDGHLVSGHVDGVGRVVEVADTRDGGRRLRFEVEPRLSVYLLDKGSVTLDGVSLTVVDPVGARFDVAVIPATLGRTSLETADVGDEVHVEADLVGKWVVRAVRNLGVASPSRIPDPSD